MEGIIIKGVGGLYTVKVEKEHYICKARGKFRHSKVIPIVGDRVSIALEDNDEGVIEKIHERTTELIRPVVANVNQALVFFTIKHPDLNHNLLYKFLVLCEYNNLDIVVCFNKMDLVNEEDNANIIRILRDVGYEVIEIAAKEGVNIDAIREKIEKNISVFCGPSGVGKSTTLNSIANRKLMETGEISHKSKRGKHTTRHSELIEYGNGLIVDTPGFSSLDLSFMDQDELKECFPEFHTEENCKFSNCNHYKEPGCAVKRAVESGEINKERYDFYIYTLEELINGRKKKW
ncbi:ribosome small subunit-dependent GTPase A [Oceanirhabdus sp. W0125-5]|uniref:ribosome small subunit-dependent GTPase A n=1 Tax=Oceanirhabdus sp. W0125-5 TaxID=2999116 RepID=UPI0022F2DE86|nr:ribosome small subunit-dependent GTPase A [Oceanirhabdus sp. W0125-5]WBW94786.1 ribosome small subunit-dependent GTPase A [Oceanirhabdus sp. W0125-5]